MTKSLLPVFILLLITWLISCNNGRTNQNKKSEETPKALQDKTLNIKEYSRYDYDLVEELYAGLVDESPELKKLENDLDAFESKLADGTKNFNKFDSKSTNYYQSADLKASTITDSLLKKKILTLIATSKNKYANKTAELHSLQGQLRKNNGTIKDHHAAIKIILTLSIIEKYQDGNLPDKKEFMELIKRQENLIQRIDSLPPGI